LTAGDVVVTATGCGTPVLRMGLRPVPHAVGAVPRDRSAGPARVALAGRPAATPV